MLSASCSGRSVQAKMVAVLSSSMHSHPIATNIDLNMTNRRIFEVLFPCYPALTLQLSCCPASVILTTRGVSCNQHRILIFVPLKWFLNSSFYRCLCNCPHYPPQPQLVWLMPLRRKEHMHQRAGARFSDESASDENWNASLCQPVYFARGLCWCIIIYLLQQNSDGTFLFEPFLVRSLRTCVSPPL